MHTTKKYIESLRLSLNDFSACFFVFVCVCCQHYLLQDLDAYLQDKVYMAGNKFTIADVFIYHGIHPLIVSDLRRRAALQRLLQCKDLGV